jgi:acyl-CoA thioesterase
LSKKRRPSRKERRKGIKKQIQYIQRNLSHIEKRREDEEVAKLSKKEENILLIIKKAYKQQVEMYENNENKVENRIVSLTQPHVRPKEARKSGNASRVWCKAISELCEWICLFIPIKLG